MNYLDIILAVPLLWSAYKGFTNGFVITLASLLALVGGIYGAIHFSAFTAVYLSKWFHPEPEYLTLISFAITFLLIIALVYLIAFLLDRIIKATGLGIFNRLAGVIFNTLKMILILSVLLSIINMGGKVKSIIPEKDKEESILYGPVSGIAPAIFPYLKFDHLRKQIKENKTPGKQVITMTVSD